MKLPKKNWLEWAVFGLSLLLVLGVAGFLTAGAIQSADTPPLITVQPGTPEPRGELVEVPLTIVNEGAQAAEDLQVEVVVRQRDGNEQRAHISVPLLPPQGSADARISVPANGEIAAVEAEVLGFTTP